MDYYSAIRNDKYGQSLWRSGLAPPAAQGVILETWDRVPHLAPCMEPAKKKEREKKRKERKRKEKKRKEKKRKEKKEKKRKERWGSLGGAAV